MKLAKRISALLLALVLVLGMTMTASAETTTPQNPSGAELGTATDLEKKDQDGKITDGGKITINDAVAGETYTIYKLLELESYNNKTPGTDDNDPYSYKVTGEWKEWLKNYRTSVKVNETEYNIPFVKVDENDYVTLADEVKNADKAVKKALTEALTEAFAKDALAFAKEKKIIATATKTASGTTVVFENLELGYYLLDTSLGALCSLDSTDQEIIIKEKNTAPTIDKQVQEDSDNSWKDVLDSDSDANKEGTFNTAQIGDTVKFKTIIKAYKGAENYVLHDTMGVIEGKKVFTLDIESVEVRKGNDTVDRSNYTIAYDQNCDHGTETDATDDCVCDFELAFKKEFLDKIDGTSDNPTILTVTYNAVLNENAKVVAGNVETDENANINTTWLSYGDGTNTADDQTKTYTYKFLLKKVAKDEVNSSETTTVYMNLSGAEFKLYDASTGGATIKVVLDNSAYRIATSTETTAEAIITAGEVEISGLDMDTEYWLEETKAPIGYNKLFDRVKVKIEKDVTEEEAKVNVILPSGTITVINEAGIRLPSTGGIGTTIFYVAGGALVLVAVVLLVTKRRMENENK